MQQNLPLVKVVQSEVDNTSITKLVEKKMSEGSLPEKKEENVKYIEPLYSPHVFAEYEIVEEKLRAGTKLELVPSIHSIVLDLLQLQIAGKPPSGLDTSASEFLDEVTGFEYLQRVPKRELAEYITKNRIVEIGKGKFLYIGYDDATAVVDYFNRLLHFWQYQRAGQEPHQVASWKGSDVSRFEASFQGNLNRVKEFKALHKCFRFYAPYWIARLETGSSYRFLVFDFNGVEQTRLGEEFTTNSQFYDFINSKAFSIGDEGS
ncbi:MAG: hypothetical protein ACE5KA_04890 [Nitrososphaerales archaeon]